MRTKEVFPYYKALKSHFIGLFIKRIFDFFVSTILLFLLAPVFLIVALWVKLDTKGPIFYIQKRVTQYGRIFWIYKFHGRECRSDRQSGDSWSRSADYKGWEMAAEIPVR